MQLSINFEKQRIKTKPAVKAKEAHASFHNKYLFNAQK